MKIQSLLMLVLNIVLEIDGDCIDPLRDAIHATYSGSLSVGNSVSLSCVTGYARIRGSTSRTCYPQTTLDSTHLWSDTPLVCGVQPSFKSMVASIHTDSPPLKYIPVGTVVGFTIKFYRGDMFKLAIYFGDGKFTIVMLNPSDPLSEITHQVDHQYKTSGTMRPYVSWTHHFQSSWTGTSPYSTTFYVEDPPDGLSISHDKSDIPVGDDITSTISVSKGTPVKGILDFGDGYFRIMDYTTSTTHTYKKPGHYTATLRTYNHIAGNSIIHSTPVKVKPRVPEFIMYSNSPIIFPDGKVQYTVEIKDSPHMASCPELVLDWEFGDTASSTRNTAAPNLTLFFAHREEHYFTLQDVGTFETRVTVSSTYGYGSVNLVTNITVVEGITNLTFNILSGSVYLVTGEDYISFEVSISNGSNMFYNVTYGDGEYDEFDVTENSFYAKDNVETFSHLYTSPGHYVPEVCAWNLVDKKCVSLTETLFVQNRIKSLGVVDHEALIALPPGEIHLTLKNWDNPQPSDITCDWQLEQPDSKARREFSHIWDDLTVNFVKAFTLDWTFIGELEIKVSCHNFISELTATASARLVQAITAAAFTLSAYSEQTHRPLTLTVSVQTGSEIQATVDFGNKSSTILSFPHTYGWRFPLIYNFEMVKYGNYSLSIRLQNEVSEVYLTASKSIHIVERIQGLHTVSVGVGITPMVTVTFRTQLLEGYPTLHDITMKWYLNGKLLRTGYIATFNAVETLDSEFELLPEEYSGVPHVMKIVYSTPLETITEEVNFLIQEPIGDTEVHLANDVIESHAIFSINITLQRGSHLQIEIDFGDDQTETLHYAQLMDQISSNEHNEQSLTIRHEMFLVGVMLDDQSWDETNGEWLGHVSWVKVDHVYSLPGKYQISAEVSNLGSKKTVYAPSMITVQNPIGCFNSTSSDLVAVPPGKAHYALHLCSILVPTDAQCEWYDGHTLLASAPFTANRDSEMTLEIDVGKDDAGEINIDVTCSNEVSTLNQSNKIQLEETISGLVISSFESKTFSLMDKILFNIAMERGSNVRVDINFGDEVFIEYEYDPLNPTIEHEYSNSGVYVINARAHNTFSSDHAELEVKVETIINRLQLEGSLEVPIPTGQTVLRILGTEHLQSVEYEWVVHEILQDSSKVLVFEDTSTDTLSMSFDCPHDGTFDVRLTAKNDISGLSTFTTLECFEIIDGLAVDMAATGLVREASAILIPLESEVHFTASCQKGVRLTYSWWQDSNRIQNEEGKDIRLKFTESGIKQIRVDVNNPVSTGSADIMVEIMQSVLIESLQLLNKPVVGKPVDLLLVMARRGTKSCIDITTGEKDEVLSFGESCVDSNTKLISSADQHKLPFQITFTTEGIKTVIVDAANTISQDRLSQNVAVNDIPCYPPNSRIEGASRDASKPEEIKRKKNTTFESFSITNCSGSVSMIYEWSAMTYDSTVISLENTLTTLSILVIQSNLLQVGLYQLTLQTEMEGMFGTSAKDTVYINVTTSSLVARIAGGKHVTVGWNQMMNFDIRDDTYDPDDLNSTISDFMLFWSCIPAVDKIPNLNNVWISEGVDLTKCHIAEYSESAHGVLTVNTANLEIGQSYLFSVVVKKDDRQSFYEQEVLVLSGRPPAIDIKCLRNCASQVKADSSLIILGSCSSCSSDTLPGYRWSLYTRNPPSSTPRIVENFESIADSDLDVPMLRLKAGVLSVGMYYTARVNVDIPGEESSYADYDFLVNSPPSGGSCRISPEEGVALQTEFTVTCQDWEDEVVGDDPAQIEYLILDMSTELEGIIISHSKDEHSTLVLPSGDQEQQYSLPLVVAIRDYLDSETRVPLDVKVKPPADVQSLVDDAVSDSGLLSSVVATKDTSRMTPAIKSITDLLAKEQDKMDDSVVDNAYEKVMKALEAQSENIQVPSELAMIADQVQQTRPKRLSPTLKDNIKASVLNAMDVIKRMPLSIEEKDTMVKKCLDTVGFLLNKTSGEVAGIQNGVVNNYQAELEIQNINATDGLESPKQAKQRIEQANKERAADLKEAKAQTADFNRALLVGVSDALRLQAQGRMEVECAQEAVTPYLTTKVQKLSRAPSDLPCHQPGQLAISRDMISDTEKEVITGEVLFTSNAFVTSDGSKDVTSEVKTLVVEAEDGSEVPLKDGASIETTLTGIHQKLEPVLIEPGEDEQFHSHKVHLDREQLQLQVTVAVFDKNLTLSCSFSVEDETTTTPDVLPATHTQTSSESETTHIYSLPLAGLQVTLAHVIIRNYNESGVLARLQPYTIDIRLMGCLQLHPTDGWTPDNCQLKAVEEEDTSRIRRTANSTVTQKQLFKVKTSQIGTIAAGLFLPPNTIDFKAVFANFSDRLLDSPVVLSVVIVIVLIYLLLLVWIRRAESTPHIKWTIFPATGNNVICDTYTYRLYIHTGLRRGASTRSRIYVHVAGDLATSGTRRLDGHWHKGFQSGTTIMYEITTTSNLGTLQYLRLWHDNSGRGRHQDWFLDEVVIKDLQTGERFYFICHKWLSLDRDDGKIERTVAVAGEENAKEFLHLLQAWFRTTLFDAHLWLSIWRRPQKSHFTRTQRLTCCLTLLLMMMVVNAMWYKAETGDSSNTAPDLFSVSIGPLVITYYQLYSSVMSSLIMFPVSMAVVQLFRRTDSIARNFSETIQDLQNYKRRNLVDKAVQSAPSGSYKGLKESAVYSHPVWPATIEGQWPYICVWVGWVLCVLTCVASAFFTVAYSLYWGGEVANQWLASFFLCAAQSIGVIGILQVIAMVVIFAILSKVPEDEHLEEEQLIRVDDVESRLVDLYVHNNHWYLVDGLRQYIQHAPNVMEQLFYQVQMLDVVVQQSVEQCEVTDEECTSTSTDDTLPIVCPSIGDGLEINLQHDPYAEGPPTDIEAERIKAQNRMKSKVKATIRSLLTRIFTICMLYVIVLGLTNDQAHNIKENLVNMFSSDAADFHKASGPRAFWQWTEEVLLPGLYAPDWYNGKEATWRERRFVHDRQAFRLGPVRLRQLRIIPAGCDLTGPLNPLVIECNPEYSLFTEDTTDYYPEWLSYADNETVTNPMWTSAFTYHSGLELGGLPIIGKMATYSAGGYVVDLPEELEDTEIHISKLKELDWLSLYTRAILVEFTLFNANANLFTYVLLLVELPPTGGSLVTQQIESFRVYATVGTFGIFVTVCCCVYIVLLLGYSWIVLRDLCFQRKKFFYSIANLLSLANAILSFMCVAGYVTRLTLINESVKKIFEAKGVFVNFHTVVVGSQSLLVLLGLVMFINLLLLLAHRDFSHYFKFASRILTKGAPAFKGYIIQFIILLVAFSIFYYCYFGPTRENFASFGATWQTLFGLFLGGGAFKFGSAMAGDTVGIIGIIVYVVLVVFMFTFMFTGMLCELIEDVGHELKEDEEKGEISVIDYIINKVQDCRNHCNDRYKDYIVYE